MEDSITKLSKPIKVENTKLSTIFTLNFGDSKKGRLFMPLYDEEYPLAFKVRYAYISKFLEKDNASGNHYHKKKEEILIPLQGAFDIYLEDIESKERELITMKGNNHRGVYVRTGVSHKIVSKDSSGIVLVLASYRSSHGDELEYKIEE